MARVVWMVPPILDMYWTRTLPTTRIPNGSRSSAPRSKRPQPHIQRFRSSTSADGRPMPGSCSTTPSARTGCTGPGGRRRDRRAVAGPAVDRRCAHLSAVVVILATARGAGEAQPPVSSRTAIWPLGGQSSHHWHGCSRVPGGPSSRAGSTRTASTPLSDAGVVASPGCTTTTVRAVPAASPQRGGAPGPSRTFPLRLPTR